MKTYLNLLDNQYSLKQSYSYKDHDNTTKIKL